MSHPDNPSGREALDAVLRVVQRHTLLPPHAILGHRREAAIVASRHAACWLLRTVTDLSLVAIGGLMGGRDHTTILHAVQQVETRRRDDAGYHGRLAVMALEVRHILSGLDDQAGAKPETPLTVCPPSVAARRAGVQKLWDAGVRKTGDFARRLLSSKATIRSDLAALGLSRPDIRAERDREVARLLSRGLTQAEVARRVGLTRTGVWKVRERLRRQQDARS